MAQLTAHQIERGNYAAQITLQTTTCPKCAITFAAPKRMLEDARDDRSITLYCPAGHSLHWPGASREEKLERELKRQKDRAAFQVARAEQAEASRRAHKAAATRARNQRDRLGKRAQAGVCPCCNRTFKQLARHMAGQHPDFDPGAGE